MSLLVNNQPYSEQAFENVYEYLRKEADREQAVEFDVFVDGLRVVRKTDDPEQLYQAHKFVRPGFTKILYINMYNYGNSNHYDRVQFHFGDVRMEDMYVTPVKSERSSKEEQGLSGIDVKRMVDDGVQQARKEMEMEYLKKEFQKLEAVVKQKDKEIEDLEADVEKLEREKAEMIARESPLKGVLGEVGAGVVESLIKRNPKTIASIIPGGDSLAGFLEEDEKKRMLRLSAPASDAEVVFTEKSQTNTLDPACTVILNLKKEIPPDEFSKILQMLDMLALDRSQLDAVHNLITESYFKNLNQ